MKIYTLKKVQQLPISLREAWEFLSAPRNLVTITPPHMGFEIVSISGSEKMYAGQIIRHKIKVFSLLKYDWVTEITHMREPFFFADEQRVGPYAFWHHQHHLRETEDGVEMTDEVHYALGYGWAGRLMNRVLVERELNGIFNYRFGVLEHIFAGKIELP